MKKIFCLLTALCLALPTYADAAEEEPAPAPRQNEANAMRSGGLGNLYAPWYDRMTSATLSSAAAHNPAELLSTLPGGFSGDRYGNRRDYYATLYGLELGRDVAVTVDGRKHGLPFSDGLDLGQIAMRRVTTMEVMPGGPASVLYGDNAAGGVINLTTQYADYRHAGAVWNSYGGFDAYAGLSNKTPLHRFGLEASHGQGGWYRKNSDTKRQDIRFYAANAEGNGALNTVTAGYYRDKTGVPGLLTAAQLSSGIGRDASAQSGAEQDTNDLYLKASPQIHLAGPFMLITDLSYRERRVTGSYDSGSGTAYNVTDGTSLELSPRLVQQMTDEGGQSLFIAGMDYRRFEGSFLRSAPSPYTAGKRTEKTDTGYYLYYQKNYHSQAKLYVGHRKDSARYAFYGATPETRRMARTATTAGFTIPVGPGFFYASFSRGFRYPFLDEVYSPSGGTVDSSLGAQSSERWETGLSDIGEGMSGSRLYYFRHTTNGEIYRTTGGGYDNLDGRTLREGIGLTMQSRTAEYFMQLSATWLKARVVGGQYEGKTIPLVPYHQVTARMYFFIPGGITAGLEGYRNGGAYLYNDHANRYAPMKPFYTVDLKITEREAKAAAYLAVRNITGHAYDGYGEAGASGAAFSPAPKRSLEFGYEIGF